MWRFREADIKRLPEPVQQYFRVCGYLGQPKMFNADVIWKESYIKLSPEKEWTPLETSQFNAVIDPVRIAHMQAVSMSLQVRDLYRNGKGHMFGKLFNLIPVVNAKGPEISQSSLITLFTEILLIPSYSLQSYITWEPVDQHTAKARFRHQQIDVSGTFHFDDTGKFRRFETHDRYYSETKGTFVKKRFSALVDDFQAKDGVQIPRKVRIIWHLDDGDYEYFKGEISEMVYNVRA
ncbi:DUF6544 family protein [Salisediminibacterium beveridgei]|nr:DUF6544 family protein [Salisediminibacterium beveridgei]